MEVIRESAFVGGRFINLFERSFAKYQQVEHCIGVANGTDAIEIALEAMALPKGSEIIVPANTFIATSEAVSRSGHRVVFCDCDPELYTISVEDASRRISSKTKAIIPVHLYGHPCDMESVLNLAAQYDLRVIEDCAQAHGSEYKGRRVGGIGDIGTFSFYPAKNLGGFGDGGAIVTNNEAFALRCRMIANHGRVEKYNHAFEGRNSRLDGIQAAILDVKLKYLDAWTEQRRELSDLYSKSLKNFPDIILPKEASWAKHVWHLFVIRCERRDSLQKYLVSKGVQTGIHYPIALPKLKAYMHLNQSNEKLFANHIDDQLLSLPMGEHLKKVDVEKIGEIIKAYFELD